MKRPILLAAMLLSAAPLHAQQAPAGRPLSLDEALATAGENNPALRSAQSGVPAASARVRQGWGAFLPSFSADLSMGGTQSRRMRGEDNFGRPLPSDSAIEQTNSNVAQSFSLSVPLFKPGRLGQLRAAQAGRRSAEARVASEGVRVRAEVERRYYQALRATRLVQLEERLLAASRERLEATRRLLRIAVRGPVDVLGAEVEVSSQEQALEKARGEVRRHQLSLREAMGVMDDEALALSSDPPSVFDPTALRADSLAAAALLANPRILQGEADVEAARRRTGAARWDRLPTVSASVNLNRNQFDQEYDALSHALSPSDRSLGVTLRFSLPIFDQFNTSASIAQARAEETRAREDARGSRLAVENEVRSARIELENAFRAHANAERTLRLARQRLELAQEQYRNGAMSFAELQIVIDRTASAEREVVDARAQFASNVSFLEQYVGGPLR